MNWTKESTIRANNLVYVSIVIECEVNHWINQCMLFNTCIVSVNLLWTNISHFEFLVFHHAKCIITSFAPRVSVFHSMYCISSSVLAGTQRSTKITFRTVHKLVDFSSYSTASISPTDPPVLALGNLQGSIVLLELNQEGVWSEWGVDCVIIADPAR